jgi:ribose transport system substrate-binding protein
LTPSDDARQSIASGAMAASVAQFPSELGRLAVETAVKLMNGESVARNQRTKIGPVTRETLSPRR